MFKKLLNSHGFDISKSALKNVGPICLWSSLIGTFMGAFTWVYSTAFEHMQHCSRDYVYAYVYSNPQYVPVLFLCLFIFAAITFLVIKYLSRQSSGCGTPYAEAEMRGLLHDRGRNGFKLLAGVLINSLLSIFAGVPLDAEGSATKIGSITGSMLSQTDGRRKFKHTSWERYMVTAGASSALACCSNAPLTGIMFSLEEGHRKFSTSIFLSTASAVLCGIITRRLLVMWTGFGSAEHFVFANSLTGMIPFEQIWMLLILGVVIGAASTLFGYIADTCNDWVREHKPNLLVSIISLFVIVGILGLTFNDALYGGTNLINKVLTNGYTWDTALLLFVVRFVLIIFAICCRGSGGLFLPMLSLGALMGYLMGYSFTFIGMDPIYISTIVVISMAAFFSSVVRAPLTGILLIVELTGEVLNGFFETGIVIFVSFVMVSLLNIVPIYDSLIDDNLEIEREGKTISSSSISIIVERGSFIDGREIRDILWPDGVSIVSIKHADTSSTEDEKNEEYVKGDNIAKPGDEFFLKIKTYFPDIAKMSIEELFIK